MAEREQRASELGATILAINIVVSVDKFAPFNGFTHCLTIINSVDQTIGHVIIGLSSASKATESLGVSILGVLGRALELTWVTFQVPATLTSTGKARVFVALNLWFSISIVPSGMTILLPRSVGSVVLGIDAQVEFDNNISAGRLTCVDRRGNDARESNRESKEGCGEEHCEKVGEQKF